MKPHIERRTFITVLLSVPALGVIGACGSGGDAAQPLTTTPDSAETDPVGTDPSGTDPGAARPEIVLSYTEPGGFTTAEFAFQNPPLVIVTGDGRLITEAVTSAVFPGPLVPQHTVRTISDNGVASMLTAAEQAGLLADVEYARNELVADASTATLLIEVDGVRYLHEAPALGLGGPGSTEDTPRSQALLDFLTTLTASVEQLAGAGSLGVPVPYEPDAYQFRATPIDDLDSFDLGPTVEAWPDGAGIALAEAGDCAAVARELVGDLFDRADQLTFFSENEVKYQVTARPAYPGRSC